MRVAAQVKLTAIERRRLETWSSARSTAVRLVERSKIVLMACAGMTNQAIAKALGIDQNTVGRWRNRFVKERVKGIEKERPRGGNHGGKDSKRQAKLRARIIGATTQTTPKDATHWSTRTMARAMGTTHSFVHRVWQSHGLKPHLVRTFKVSNDPRFEASSAESVGEFWFGQVAKCVIQSDFQCPGGAEPIRPFGDHSGLSVEAFDNATGELPPGSEPVQKQVAVRAQPCGQPPSSGRAASASSGCTSGRGTGRPSTATRSPTAIESPP